MALPLRVVNLAVQNRLLVCRAHIPRDDPVTMAVLCPPAGVASVCVHLGACVATRGRVANLGEACQKVLAGRRKDMMSAQEERWVYELN